MLGNPIHILMYAELHTIEINELDLPIYMIYMMYETRRTRLNNMLVCWLAGLLVCILNFREFAHLAHVPA